MRRKGLIQSVLIAAIFILSPAITLLDPGSVGAQTRAPRSGDYPVNHILQDYEPSVDEQFDLDVARDDQGRFFAVWADTRLRYSDIRTTKSSDGTSWGDGEMNNNDLIVNDDSGEGAEHYHPSITVDDENILYCCWVSEKDGGTEIRMSNSTSLGNTWSSSWTAINTTGRVSEPYIRWSPTIGLCLVYIEEVEGPGGEGVQKDIFFSSSKDGGKNFSPRIDINDDETGEDQIHPRIDVSDQGAVAIVWQDYRNGNTLTGTNSDIFMSMTENGLTFTEDIRVGEGDPDLKQENPDICFTDAGDVAVVWEQRETQGWRIYYSIAWTASEDWISQMTVPSRAVRENVSRKDQFMPRVGYVDGALALAWTEYDIRDYILVRTGYLSRAGDRLDRDHIVDDTIDWGYRPKEPDIDYAEMFKKTAQVIDGTERAHVFWLDYRTDPLPADGIPEDGDPYYAAAFPPENMPKEPSKPVLELTYKDWDSVTLEWERSMDIEFEAYYLTYGEGEAQVPDILLNDARSDDRLDNSHKFEGLRPKTDYQFRLMVRDRSNNRVYSDPLEVETQRNDPPTFNFLEPDGEDDWVDEGFFISWTVSDNEETANYTLYYDTDQDPAGQVFLTEGNTDDDGEQGSFYWNTSGIENGGYTINATVTDGVNEPVAVYSTSIIVQHRDEHVDHPTVFSTQIEGGKDSAFADTVIQITFDTPMSTVSLNPDNIYVLSVEDYSRSEVDGSISIIDDQVIEWRPENLLRFGTYHELVIKPDVKDINGIGLDGERVGEESTYIFGFRTIPEDGVPHIRSWAPQGADADPWPVLEIEFDIFMDPSSFVSGSVELAGDSGTVPLELTYVASELKLRGEPLHPLMPNSTYSVSLKGSIVSAKGERIANNFSWNFTTGPADMTKDTDADGVPDDLDWFPNDRSESSDLDRDGIGDNADKDDDGDGMPDEWEIKYGFDPTDPSDAEEDPDGDGLTNLEEYKEGSRPIGEEADDGLDAIYLYGAIILALFILIALVLFAVLQRKNLEKERLETSFFKEE